MLMNTWAEAEADGSLGLAVPPLVMAGEPFEIELDAVRAANLTISAASVQGPGAKVVSERVKVGEEGGGSRHTLTLSKPGTYQVDRSVLPTPLVR